MTAPATLTIAPATSTPPARLSSPPGLVAGTVLRAARLSARLTQAQLAAAVSTAEATVAAWEDGTEPLADVPYPVLQQLQAALTTATADPALAADVTAATWCDLVLAALTDPPELMCLMSDPLAAEPAFAELLTWTADDRRPERYRPYAAPGPLPRNDDLGLMAGTIRKLCQVAKSAARRAT